MTNSDAELLRRYAHEGAESAFAELVQRHLKLVYLAAWRRTGDPHLAEDVAQYVFTALARDAAALSRHVVLTGWLYTTTRFASAKLLRTERRRRAREQEAFIMQQTSASSTPPSPGPAVNWEQVRPVVDATLDALSERDREAVLLRFFEERPFAEIGAMLQVTEDAARMRVERALDKLRGLLARRGIASTSAALALALTNQAAAAVPGDLAAAVTGSALAQAAAAAGGAGVFANVFGFMSTTKLVASLVAAALLIAALGTATYEMMARRTEEAALAAATRDHAALAAKLGQVQRQAQRAEAEAAQLKSRLDEARSARAAAVAAARVAAEAEAARLAASEDPAAAGDAFMGRHPEVKESVNAYAKARLQFKYGELFRALNLTPAQIDQFSATMRFGMGASLRDGKSLSLRSGETVSSADYGPRLNAVFDEDGMKKYYEFSRTAEARELVVKVAGALYFSETPLTPAQSDQLVEIMAGNRTAGREWQPQRYDWDAVLAKARGLLSDAQLAAVTALRAKDQFQQALNAPLAPK